MLGYSRLKDKINCIIIIMKLENFMFLFLGIRNMDKRGKIDLGKLSL